MPISSNSTTMEIPLQCSLDDYEDLCQQVSELTMEEASEELLDAARHGDSDVIRAILSSFDVVNVTDAELSTPLHKACANGHVPCVQLLLTHDATLRPNASGNTPLHWAAANGHDKVVHLLLEHFDYEDIDVLTKNNFGRSALTEGFASDNVLVANLLLSHDSATEEKLLGGTTSTTIREQEDNDDPMDVETNSNNHATMKTPSITHSFLFGSTVVLVRELPIANADDPFGQAPHDDTTGYGIWAASLVMSQWMAQLSNRFVDKHILELGAGCGVPGLTVATSSQAASVILTDLNATTVENLHYNVGLNEFSGTTTTAAIIDWDDISTYPSQKMDIVLGSDLIYQKSIVPYLKKVVLGVLNEGGRFLYVAPNTGRDGLDEFIASMKHNGVQLVSQQVAPKAFHSNPLENGDDEDFFLHFHEVASSTYVLYEFERTYSS